MNECRRRVLGAVIGSILALAATAPAATFVGSAKCAPCHATETTAWSTSHHARAMSAPSADSVRGRFDGAGFTKDGVTTTFSTKDGTWIVRTDGPDGALHDYPVAWTYGWEPLQQYLLALPGGRLQALPIAWDTQAKRWLDLYPAERIDHRDELHWTGAQQNWNFMCAECHSTNLVKGYRVDGDRFDTTWTEVNVACEACHGPGSAHVSDPKHAMPVTLRAPGAWTRAPDAAIAHRTAPRSGVELETCGRCHARGAQVWADDPPGQPLAQTHRVALLDAGLYHADGQIEGEVYEYGSFVQSRMHAAGVSCSDCHEPHSGGLRAEGNALCSTCHRPETFDVPAHHHHEPGATCVSCHMRERTYMMVDGRRDHSFRVPRPDLTVTIGTPNACADCHRDRSATWAEEAVAAWRGPDRPPPWHWAQGIHAGRTRALGAAELLHRVAGDRAVPGIARATAVALLAGVPDRSLAGTLERAVADGDPLVRRAAADTAAVLPPDDRRRLAAPLLRDPMRTVRFEALGSLLDVPEAAAIADLQRVAAEYRQAQGYNADRVESWFNLGMLEGRLGDAAAARAALETAIRRRPTWAAPYVELADVQRRGGDETAAEATLRRAVTAAPKDADAQAALGLSLVRSGKRADALAALKAASELAPDAARHAYVYAIALHDSGDVRGAIGVLERAESTHPGSADVLVALAQYSTEAGDRAAALRWAKRLAAATGDPAARQMVERLEGRP